MSERVSLIILDRDGVINEDSKAFIKHLDEWKPIPGSIEAIARLSKAGFSVAVASNQSGIARGLFSLDALQAMHAKLLHLVEVAGGHIDAIAFCPHGPDDECDCRKPKPGLLKTIAKTLELPLTEAIVVGDSLRDLEAGERVFAKPILVLTGKGQGTLAAHPELSERVDIYPDLAHFVADFLERHQA